MEEEAQNEAWVERQRTVMTMSWRPGGAYTVWSCLVGRLLCGTKLGVEDSKYIERHLLLPILQGAM